MPTLSTGAKIGVAVGIAAAAVGAYVLYRHAANVVAAEEAADPPASADEPVAAAAPAAPSTVDKKPTKSAAPPPAAATAEEGSTAGTAAAAASTAAAAAAPAPAAGTQQILSKDQLAMVLVGILQSTQQLVQALMQRQNNPQTKLPPAQLKQMFEMQSSLLHQKILQTSGINHEMFQASMMAHKDDARIRALMAQSLRMGDALLPEIPADMTLDTFLPILTNVMEAFVTGTQAAVEEAKASGLEGEALAQKVMELAQSKVESHQETSLKEANMTKELFQACLTQYMSDSRVQNTVMTAQQQAMQIVQAAAPGSDLA